MTLAEFIVARLDDDEAAAKAARDEPGAPHSPWRAYQFAFIGRPWRISRTYAHIAMHDPTRVLREAAVKRAILDLHEPDEYGCQRCEESGFTCRTLRELGAVWSDHPDYRAEWKP